MNRLDLLKKELAELEEKVRTTKELIQAEETSIANSKQETQEIAEQNTSRVCRDQHLESADSYRR